MKSVLKSKIVIIIAIILLLAISAIITTVTVISGSKERQVSKQLSLGEKYLSELEHEKAIIAFNKVIEIEPRNMSAYLGLAEAYEGLGKDEEAIKALEVAISIIKDAKDYNNEVLDNSEDIYILLAKLYEDSGDREKAFRTLLEGYELTDSNKIAKLLKDYYPEIEASVEPGTYTEVQLVSFSSSGDKIYFTVDGSDPTKKSKVYNVPIEVSEESITIKAVAENEYGELGDINSYTYVINLNNGSYLLQEGLQSPEQNVDEAKQVLTDMEILFCNSLSDKQNTLLADLNEALHRCDHDTTWNIITSDEYMALSEILPDINSQTIHMSNGLTLQLMRSIVGSQYYDCGAWINPDSAGNGEFTRTHFGYWVDEDGERYADFYSLESAQYKDGIANGDYWYTGINQSYGDYASWKYWESHQITGHIKNGFKHGEEVGVHVIDDEGTFRTSRYLTIYENGKVIPFGTEIIDGQIYYQVSKNIDTGEFSIADADYLEQYVTFPIY